MRPHESEGIAFFRVVYTLLVMILPLGTSNKKWSNILRGGLYLTAFSSAQQSQSPTNVLCGGERLRRLRSLMFSLRCNDTSIARAGASGQSPSGGACWETSEARYASKEGWRATHLFGRCCHKRWIAAIANVTSHLIKATLEVYPGHAPDRL